MDKFPFRYSTVAYMDVHAFSDAEHEAICTELRELLEKYSGAVVVNVQVGEV